MKKIIEIRSAEGGADSQLFVKDLAQAYGKLFNKFGWKHHVLKERPSDIGFFEISIQVDGKDLSKLHNEAGGHRIQRIPPTEKRGRVHTSTVTVAVLDSDIKADDKFMRLEDSDFRIEWFSGTGAGGQHRNKVQNSCRLIHIPTGIIETRQGRERSKNLKEAKDAILKTLEQNKNRSTSLEQSTERKGQVGSGMRGDKSVTIRFQDDRVTHSNGKSMTATRYMKGHMDDVWE